MPATDLRKLSAYDYDLPAGRIAQYPAARRDDSRLLVLHRTSGAIHHTTFSNLPEFMDSGSTLVLNETRVLPARLFGHRPGTGGRIELLLLRRDGDCWEALARPARRLKPGAAIAFQGETLRAVIHAVLPSGARRIRFEGGGPGPSCGGDPVEDLLARSGHMPLPPYIRREDEPVDRERYQTVYARTPGAVAAPTAGLHFTPRLLSELEARGVGNTRVLLHVGPGTFKPVEVDDITAHRIDAEYGEIGAEAAGALNRTRQGGGRIVAVGTTSVRLLESAAVRKDGGWAAAPWSGWTRAFIHPPYEFRLVDALITNFHLPRSTLLMLVAAFAGYRQTMEAYRVAVAEGYRFYSYGDAMLIL